MKKKTVGFMIYCKCGCGKMFLKKKANQSYYSKECLGKATRIKQKEKRDGLKTAVGKRCGYEGCERMVAKGNHFLCEAHFKGIYY